MPASPKRVGCNPSEHVGHLRADCLFQKPGFQHLQGYICSCLYRLKSSEKKEFVLITWLARSTSFCSIWSAFVGDTFGSIAMLAIDN